MAGVGIDLHGARLQRPARLSMPTPAGITAADQIALVRLAEIGEASHLMVVGEAHIENGELVAVVDPNGLPFYGIRRGGRYAFVRVAPALAFVQGVIADVGGFPLRGGLISAAGAALVTQTDPNGQYVLAVPLGPVTLTVTDLRTADTLTLSGNAGDTLNASLSPTPPDVASLSPADGTTGIALSAAVVISFTEAIDAASLNDTTVRLILTDDGTTVAVVRSLSPDRRVVTLRPTMLLQSDTAYAIEVTTGIRDLNGRGLVTPQTVNFHTVDTTPPLRPPAGNLTASIPVDGFSTVRATQGTVQPDWIVTVANRTSGARTSVIPEADGSFNVRVPAQYHHRLELELIDASGLSTVMAVPSFANADGSVIIGSEGGTVTGADNTAVNIPAGAFPNGTLVKIAPLSAADLPIPAPAEAPFVGAVTLETGGQMAEQALDLSVPAPADATAQDQVVVARYVTYPGGSGWMVMDRAYLQDGRYSTAAQPQAVGRAPGLASLSASLTGLAWQKGIFTGGSFSFLRVSNEGACMSYVQVDYSLSFDFVMLPQAPYIVVPGFTPPAIQVARFPALCNSALEIDIIRPQTGDLVERITRRAPAQRDFVGNTPADANSDDGQNAISDDKKPPRLLRHNLYSGYQLDNVELLFSKKMNVESVKDNIVVQRANTGERLRGTWQSYDKQTLFVFTPEAPFRHGEEYTVIFGAATDAQPNANKLNEANLMVTIFEPHVVTDLATLIGTAAGTQAAANIGDILFVAHAATDTAPSAIGQILSVVKSEVVTGTQMIGQAPTGLIRLRALAALPDIFLESPTAKNYPLDLEPTTVITSFLRPIAILTTTLPVSITNEIVAEMDKGVITETLKLLFAQEIERPLHRRAELFRATVAQPDGSEQVQYFIHSRGDRYLIEQLPDEQLQISVGRDLLALLGTTEPLTGGMELLEIYDVTPCTKPDLPGMPQGDNCLNPATMTLSRKVLNDPKNALSLPRFYPNVSNVPKEIGVPVSLAVANVPVDGVAAVYIVNTGIGLQAVDVGLAPNMPNPLNTRFNLAPTGLVRGQFNDVAVLNGLVLATKKEDKENHPQLRIYDNRLEPVVKEGGTTPFLMDFNAVSSVAAGRFVYDMDEDGNLGEAENGFDLPTGEGPNAGLIRDDNEATDELFDLAFVTAPLVNGNGALWIVDLNKVTDLAALNRYSGSANELRIVASVPLPPGAREISIDPARHAAYVEISGRGVATVDLRGLIPDLAQVRTLTGHAAPTLLDLDGDKIDDRLLSITNMSDLAHRGDLDLDEDPNRPLAFTARNNSGVELLKVCNSCQELILDFRRIENWVDQNQKVKSEAEKSERQDDDEEDARNQPYRDEYNTLVYLLGRVVISLTAEIPGLMPADIYVIEQGSGGCFWRDAFKTSPAQTCAAFTPRISDHDYEVFVPAPFVRRAQTVMDAFVRQPPTEQDKTELKKLEDFTLFAMPREPFDLGVLLSSPPMNKEGDTAGDLGLGRQSLLLLWLLTTGEYPPVGRYHPDVITEMARPENAERARQTAAPDLEELVRCLSINRMYNRENAEKAKCDADTPMFAPALYPSIYFTDTATSPAQIAARPPFTPQTGIPPVEGYEWAVLQEYNLYKTGVMVRIHGGCNFETDDDGAHFFFTEPGLSGTLDSNHVDRAFDDADAFTGDCKSQLKTVGKSAIRTAFAVMVAHPQGNALLMQGRYPGDAWASDGSVKAGAQPISLTRNSLISGAFCLTGVDDIFSPPTDPFIYADRPCQGFEDYVVTMAVESLRRGYAIFEPDEAALIWRFWCVKVWKGCSDAGVAPIRNESEANEFISGAADFIERAQRKTRPIYDYTQAKDITTLQQIADNPLADMDAYPFMADICGVCAVNLASSRGTLRQCNLVNATAKVYGDPSQHADLLRYFNGEPVQLATVLPMSKIKKLGVKYSVSMKLQTRAGNASANDLYDVLLAIYEGEATADGDYRDGERMDDYVIDYLPAGARTVIDVEKVPNKPSKPPVQPDQCVPLSRDEREEYPLPTLPTKDSQIFTAVFAVTETLKIKNDGDGARAIAFVIDPDGELVEADKANNQTAFFYYPLDRSAPLADNTPPSLPTRAPFVLTEFPTGAICTAVPLLDLDVTVHALGDTTAGQESVAVQRDSEIETLYTVQNRSALTITDVIVERNGQTFFRLTQLAPGEKVTRIETERLTRVRAYLYAATATGRQPDGQPVVPATDRAWAQVLGRITPVEITLYDATDLNTRDHPFTRWSVHHTAETGNALPIRGAVTDGHARILVTIDTSKLTPGEPLQIRLKDSLVASETEGIGTLRLEETNGNLIASGTSLQVNDLSGLGQTALLYYVPPHLFVRPDHHEIDSFTNARFQIPRTIRKVKLEAEQPEIATGRTDIELMRPPLFVFHGLGGNPSVWNDFFPLVPVSGVSMTTDQYVSGYDGRFKLFAAGSNGTVRPTDEEAKGNYARFKEALRNPDFDGFAISKVDVVAFSMGGVISREMVRQFVDDLGLEAPFGRLVTIGTPHIGSPVAIYVTDTRDLAKQLELDFDPMSIDTAWMKTQSAEVKNFIQMNWCAAFLQATASGYPLGEVLPFVRWYEPSLDTTSGAVDDLRPDSQRMAILAAAGTQVPTHYIVGQMDTANLGATTLVSGLWSGLAVLCYWTPDQNTVERTKQVAYTPGALWQVARVLFAGDVIAGFKFLKTAAESISGNTQEPTQLLSTVNGQPSGGNDRIVPARSQRADAPPNAPYITSVIANTDHMHLKITNVGEFHDNSVRRCNEYMAAAWDSLTQQPSVAITDNDLVVCKTIFLLESDPNGKNEIANAPLFRPVDADAQRLTADSGPQMADDATRQSPVTMPRFAHFACGTRHRHPPIPDAADPKARRRGESRAGDQRHRGRAHDGNPGKSRRGRLGSDCGDPHEQWHPLVHSQLHRCQHRHWADHAGRDWRLPWRGPHRCDLLLRRRGCDRRSRRAAFCGVGRAAAHRIGRGGTGCGERSLCRRRGARSHRTGIGNHLSQPQPGGTRRQRRWRDSGAGARHRYPACHGAPSAHRQKRCSLDTGARRHPRRRDQHYPRGRCWPDTDSGPGDQGYAFRCGQPGRRR